MIYRENGKIKLVSKDEIDHLVHSWTQDLRFGHSYIIYFNDDTPSISIQLNLDQSHDMMDNQLYCEILEHWEKHNIPEIPKD